MGVFSFSRPQRNGRAEAQRSLCDPTPPLLRPSAPSLPPVHYQPPYLFRSIKDCRVVAGPGHFRLFRQAIIADVKIPNALTLKK